MYKLLIIMCLFIIGCERPANLPRLKYKKGDVVRLKVDPETAVVITCAFDAAYMGDDYKVAYKDKKGSVRSLFIDQEEIVNE